jgi:hypothetical protein
MNRIPVQTNSLKFKRNPFFSHTSLDHLLSHSILICSVVQAYLGDSAGLVPDHRNKASHTNFLGSQCI